MSPLEVAAGSIAILAFGIGALILLGWLQSRKDEKQRAIDD